jgi:transglutaminase-like putative cysteine protease
MIAPRGLLGAAFVLWGASTGHFVLGIAAAIAIEAVRFARGSAQSSRRQIRVIRASVFAAGALLATTVATSRFPEALYLWLRWLPLAILPLALMQALAGGSIAWSVVAEAFRPGRTREAPRGGADTTYALLVIVLIGAGTADAMGKAFYPAVAVLAAWALVARVPRGRRLAAGVAFVLAASLGLAVHNGLATLQGKVEEWSEELLAEYFVGNQDPYRERTRIGELGRIKMSDRILMRVVTAGPRPPSILLREAAFDQYRNGEWRASSRAFAPVLRDGARWIVRADEGPARLTVRRSLPGGDGLLALPAGTTTIADLQAAAVERSPAGAVRARGASRFLATTASYELSSEVGSLEEDLMVPALLAPTLEQLVAGHALKRLSPRETLAAIEGFFARDFAYTLNPAAKDGGGRTLSDFLLRDHRGHCEYFATATTLLLRQAGIPARYTVGYSVQEYSPFERAFLVRNRHSHAWTSAMIDGRWITVDTTPSRWAADEGEAARGLFGPILDFLSWLTDRIIQWWLETAFEDMVRGLGIAAGLGAVAWAAVIAVMKLRRRSASASPRRGRSTAALRRVERALAAMGFARHAGETPREWARRIHASEPPPPWRSEIGDLVEAYYRLRFDPRAPAGAAERFIAAADAFRRSLNRARPRLAAGGI